MTIIVQQMPRNMFLYHSPLLLHPLACLADIAAQMFSPDPDQSLIFIFRSQVRERSPAGRLSIHIENDLFEIFQKLSTHATSVMHFIMGFDWLLWNVISNQYQQK